MRPEDFPTIAPWELAPWLGYETARAFQNAASGLIRSHGFPRRLAGRPVWSRQAVLQWIARQGGVEPAMAIAGAPVLELTDDELEAIRRDLEARYAGDGFRPGEYGEAAE